MTEVESDLAEGVFFVKLADGFQLSEESVREIVTDAGFTLRSFETVDDTSKDE